MSLYTTRLIIYHSYGWVLTLIQALIFISIIAFGAMDTYMNYLLLKAHPEQSIDRNILWLRLSFYIIVSIIITLIIQKIKKVWYQQ